MLDLGRLTVARRYATAYFELAREAGRVEAVAEDLAALRSAISSDPTIVARLRDPKVRGSEKSELVRAKLAAGRDPLTAKLLGVLVARRREDLLPEVFFAFAEALERHEGIVRVEVETATPLAQSVVLDVGRRLGEASGRKIAVEARVRPELLGGMRLVVDSKVVDGSVASKLDRLKRKLLSAPV